MGEWLEAVSGNREKWVGPGTEGGARASLEVGSGWGRQDRRSEAEVGRARAGAGRRRLESSKMGREGSRAG